MKTKKASAGTPAGKKLQSLSYLKPAQQSSLKIQIGELLLFGNRSQKSFWSLLNVMLQQYFTLKQIGEK